MWNSSAGGGELGLQYEDVDHVLTDGSYGSTESRDPPAYADSSVKIKKNKFINIYTFTY